MNKLLTKSTLNWAIALLLNGIGICLCTRSGMGLSMIAASPYILHVWARSALSAFFTHGVCEYVWEAILLIILCLILRRFRWKYLLSFMTAMILGFIIDGWYAVLGGSTIYPTLWGRILALIGGMVASSMGVAFFFRTQMPLEVYELAVTEIAGTYHKVTEKVKFWFDVTMLTVSLLLALGLNRSLAGFGIGTIIMTACNAPLIAISGKIIDKAEHNQ